MSKKATQNHIKKGKKANTLKGAEPKRLGIFCIIQPGHMQLRLEKAAKPSLHPWGTHGEKRKLFKGHARIFFRGQAGTCGKPFWGQALAESLVSHQQAKKKQKEEERRPHNKRRTKHTK